ncbi:MAG: hypothetical protein H7144_04080 [Burkholderiales bacterium]|nr:hypothetical protein [Phycisphaerae bacterium]
MRHCINTIAFPESVGVYVVYANACNIKPLYVGKAARQTLSKRWKSQHLQPRAGGSALRRTLGIHLGLVREKLKRPERYYSPEIEEAITIYLRSCFIELLECANAVEAAELELKSIRTLNPLLNISGRSNGVT